MPACLKIDLAVLMSTPPAWRGTVTLPGLAEWTYWQWEPLVVLSYQPSALRIFSISLTSTGPSFQSYRLCA